MSESSSPDATDEPASAVPDPRDRRRSERRTGEDRRGGSPRGEPGDQVGSEDADSPDAPEKEGDSEGNDSGRPDERRGQDRRSGDRRSSPDVPEEYRAGKRRINEYPLRKDELEFINAINAYKTRYNKPFPTWSEVLHIVKALGYRRSVRFPGPRPDQER